MVATFTPNAFTPLLPEYWGINRIQEQEQPGEDIFELSTITDRLLSGLLIPLEGQDYLSIALDISDNIVLTCRIDYTKLQPGKNYDLSTRLGRSEVEVLPGAYSDGYDTDNAYD